MEGNPKAPDKMSIVNVVTVGAVGSALVWVSIVALQAYYKNTLDTAEQARQVEGQDVELRNTRAEQDARLLNYGTRDDAIRKKKAVTLKIDRAMELVVAELQQNPRASAVPDVGPHDSPTVQATPPYAPVVKAAPPAPAPTPPTDGAAPADGAEPAPADGAKPADGAEPAPADGAKPAGGDATP